MPAINIHGKGSNPPPPGSSSVPWASPKFARANKAFEKMLADAASGQAPEALMQSIPWLNPKFKQVNKNLERMIERESRKAESEAKSNLSMSIPWMDPKIQRINRRMREAHERQVREAEAEARRQMSRAAQMGQQEWALKRVYSHLQHRAGWHLTPSTFRNIHHAGDIYNERIEAYTKRWGSAPNVPAIGNILSTMGTMRGTFGVGNAMRLGGMGQRAAEERRYTELVKIEHELRRLENIAAKQYKLATSPAELANIERQKNAILYARERISSGLAGNHPLMNKVGRAFGTVGAMVESPLAMGVMGAASLAAAVGTAPYTAAQTYQWWVGLQERGLKFNLGTQALSRGTGYNGRSLRNQLMRPVGFGSSFSTLPSDWLSPQAAALGIGPEDALRNLHAYGIAMPNAEMSMGLLSRGRAASLMPGNMLGENTIFSMLGQTASLHGVQPNYAGYQKFFSEMLKTEISATRQGIDASRFAESWQKFYATAAQSGLSSNFSGLSSFFRNMLASGAPGASTGALQNSILAGTQKTISQIGVGGPPPLNAAILSYFHGKLPTTEAGLRSALGLGSDVKLNPLALKNYLSAAKSNPAFALNYLQPLLNGQSPDVVKRLIENSPLIKGLPTYAQGVAASNLENITLTQHTGWGQAGPSSGDYTSRLNSKTLTSGMGMLPYIAAAAQKWGVPIDVAMALVQKESGFNPNAKAKGSSATGLGQVTQGALDDYNRHNKTSLSLSDLKDPAIGADVSMWYLKQGYGTYGSWNTAYQAKYHNLAAVGASPTAIMADTHQFAGMRSNWTPLAQTLGGQGKLAGAQAAGIAGSEMVAELSDKVVALFHGAAGAVDGLAQAAGRAARELNKIAGPGLAHYGEAMSPPLFTIPSSNDRSGVVSK